MNSKTAIFVDFENLRKGVFDKAYKNLKLFFDYNNNANAIIDFCNLCVFDTFEEKDLYNLYRIFLYTAKPPKGHKAEKNINELFSKLEQLNHTAIRFGKLVKRDENVYVQKQVDMLLGIDMVEISFKKFVDKVVLIGYDSDMAPALKIARMNGIQTEIIVFSDLNKHIEKSLYKHCDFAKEVEIKKIYKLLHDKKYQNMKFTKNSY